MSKATMAMAAQQRLAHFTSTIHSDIPASRHPSNHKLSDNFSVCIIGASRGIGASIATSYAQAGAGSIILAARSAENMQEISKKITKINPSAKTCIFTCDIANSDSVASLALSIKRQGGHLDALVVNSGISGKFFYKITEGDPQEYARNFGVNTIGTLLAAHHLIPLLLTTPGGAKQFIAVGSMGAWYVSGPGANTPYNTSKLAQARIVEMVAEQYKDEGLLVVTLHPGGVKTDMLEIVPKEIIPFLNDDVALCGSFCVWLSAKRDEVMWLTGRFVSSKWDTDELLQRKEDVVEKDMLKARVVA